MRAARLSRRARINQKRAQRLGPLRYPMIFTGAGSFARTKREKEKVKKLVLKTAAITLAAIIFAGALLFGGLWLFSPVTLAKIAQDLGNDSAATSFYARGYDLSGKYEDLHAVCAVLDEHENPELAVKYLEKFVQDENFTKYFITGEVAEKEGKNAPAYYAGKYAVATFIVYGAERAATLCAELAFGKYYGNDEWSNVAQGIIRAPYSFYDCFGAVLSDGRLSLSRADLNIIKEKITSVEVTYDDDYKAADLKTVQELLKALSE